MIEVSQLGRADNRWSYNTSPWVQNPVVTVGGTQWTAWWDTRRHPIVATRTLGGTWATRDLHDVAGNALASPVAQDGHNSLAVGVDPDGQVHLAGNMHNSPMRYMRTVDGDIAGAWTASNPPASFTEQVTYPKFLVIQGQLCLVYRDGGSGNGDIFLDRWDGQEWSPTMILDGKSSGESPYLQRVVVDGDNVHVAALWRDSPDGTTNEDVTHMVSRDGGVSWETMDGTSLTSPVTHSTIDMVYDTATDVGLVGSCGMDVDTAGNPHITMLIEEGTAHRVLYATWDGEWDVNLLASDWQHRMPLDPRDGSIAAPQVVCQSGRVFAVTRNNVDVPGVVEVREISGGVDGPRGPMLNVDLVTAGLPVEITSTHLRLMATPTGTGLSDEPISIVTVPLGDLAAIVDGQATVPSSLETSEVAAPGLSTARIRRAVTWLGCDAATGKIISELPDTTGRTSRLLGAYASSSLTVPIPLAGPGALGPAVFQATEERRSIIVAVVNDVPAWAGLVLENDRGSPATMRLGCVTLEGYLDRRNVRDHRFDQVDQCTIMSTLARDAEDISGRGQGIGLTHDIVLSGILRDETYEAVDRATVYDRMQEMSQRVNGPEWVIDTEWDNDAQTTIAKVLRVAPQIGSASQAVFEVFDTGSEGAASYTLTSDYSDGRGANWIEAYSSGEGDDQPASAPAVNQDDLDAGVPIFERHFQPSSSIRSQSVLDDHAESELDRVNRGTQTWDVQARWTEYPRYGVDWRLGDVVRLELQGHGHPDGVSTVARVIGWDLDLEGGLVRPQLEVA